MKRWVCATLLLICSASYIHAEQAASASLWERNTLTGDWNGLRSHLSDKGFNIGLEYTGEFLANASGGIQRGELYQGLVATSLDFDLEKMTGWKGGQVHISSLWLKGTEPNSRNDIAGLTGSAYSDPSNISGYDSYRLYELWLEQNFWGDKLAIKFGQIALDEEFICNDYACLFLSGTHGWPAFVASTIPDGGQAYPVAGTGLRIKFTPAERFEFMAAVMDGDVHDQTSDNRNGTHFGFHSNEGLLSIFEVAFKLNQKPGDKGLPGTYKIGGWYHSGRFDDLRRDNAGGSLEDDGTLSGSPSTGAPASYVGNGGIYFDASQMIWREQPDSDKGCGIYVRVAPWLPDDRNPINFYAAGGIIFKGLIPQRAQDTCGIGINYARVSDSLRKAQREANRIAANGGAPNNLSPAPVPDYEMAVEATYQINVAPWWTIQPDFQYIIHPGGSRAIDNALVIGLRTTISF